MKELPNNILKCSCEYKLFNLKNDIVNYMIQFSYDNIVWKSLTNNEMKMFLTNNYYRNNKFITWDDDTILGMHYLHWHLYTDKYFIGMIKNNINKETIVGCISYFDFHEIYGNINYISTVEINYFYQGMGLLDKMYENFVKELNFNKNVMITSESLIGRKCHVINNLTKVLRKNGYNGDIVIDD